MTIPTAEQEREAKAFCAALCSGDVEGARRSLESSAFVRAHINEPAFEFGQRALHMAADNVAMLDVLMAFGADVNLKSDWRNGPYAVLDRANEESARFLMSRGATLTPNVASRLGWLDQLTRLIEADPAAVNARGGDGQQPLHEAKSVAIADVLLDHGAEVDGRCIDHRSTPAQYALAERPDVCRRLLERGATPDIFMPARLGDVALAERLVRAHPEAVAARVNEPSYDLVPPFNIYCWTLGFSLSPHAVALKYGHADVYRLLVRHSPPGVRFLEAATRGDEATARAAMADADSLPGSLTTAQHAQLAHAIFQGRFAAADVMLGLGFDPAAGGVDGGSALHAAAWMGHVDLIDRLIRLGTIAVDSRDPTHGSTVLGWAAFGSVHRRAKTGDYVGAIDRIVAAGADVTAPANSAGETYLGMAEGNPDVQAALRRHGAR